MRSSKPLADSKSVRQPLLFMPFQVAWVGVMWFISQANSGLPTSFVHLNESFKPCCMSHCRLNARPDCMSSCESSLLMPMGNLK